MTGLLECGLGWGCILAHSSDLWGTGGGFLLYFIFVDGRELVGQSDFGLPDARVELSRCTTDKAIWDWGPPSNVLLLGCASSDR